MEKKIFNELRPDGHRKRITHYLLSKIIQPTLVLLFIISFFQMKVSYSQPCQTLCNTELIQNNNVLLNPNLTFPIPAGEARRSFGNGWVDGWFASHSTPHHTQFDPNGGCSPLWSMPNGTETNCFITSITQTEGIFTNLLLTNDPLVTYHLSYGIQALNCANTLVPRHFVNVRIAQGLVPYTGQSSSPLPNVPTFSLGRHLVNNYNNFQNCVHFNLPQHSDFGQLWFYTEYDNPSSFEVAYTSLQSIRMHCTTKALSNITVSGGNLTYQFSAVNASSHSGFIKYIWDFGDGNSSSSASPVHNYTSPGTYSVCLNILDNNNCCGSHCVQVIADCKGPIATFNISGACPTYNLTATQSAGISTYQWSTSEGTITDNNAQNASVFFSSNGTYTVTLTVTDACGNTASSTQQVVVDCVQPPSSCQDQSSCISIGTGPTSVTMLSDLLLGPNPVIPSTQWFFAYRVKNICISLQGTLIVDVAQVLFENTHWYNGPGAEIRISDFGSWGSVWFLESTLQGCGQMWGGIVLPDGQGGFFSSASGIALRGSTVRDAYRAVVLGDKRGISAFNSHFLDNYVGIYTSEGVQKNILFNFKASRFENTGNMLPAYPGQPEWSSRYFAGMQINDVVLLQVESPLNEQNSFININTGIYCRRSNVGIMGALFEDSDLFQSRGIHIEQSGAVIDINTQNTFRNLNVAIDMEGGSRSLINIRDNVFYADRSGISNIPNDIVPKGLFVRNHGQSRLNFDNNNRLEFFTGVGVHVNSNLSKLILNDNYFHSTGPSFRSIWLIGVQSKGSVNDNLFDFNPSVTFAQRAVAIHNCRLLDFRKNHFIGHHNTG
mgnify:CR=1 FL=1